MPASTETLGALRAKVQARTGFAAAGAGAGVNAGLIESFLQTAQEEIYWAADWKYLEEYADKVVGAGQTLIDYPANAHPDRILKMSVQVNGLWIPLKEGIEPELYTYLDNRYYPQRFERRQPQIELWPEADQIYTVKIWYIRELAPFSAQGDFCTVDPVLLLMKAIGDAKLHYRQADGQIYLDRVERHLARQKAKTFSTRNFRRRTHADLPIPKPVVVP